MLAMTYSDTEPRGTLRYRLLASSMRPSTSPLDAPGEWGHEYVRHLAAELGEEYDLRTQEGASGEPTASEPTESADDDEEAKKAAAESKPLTVGTVDDLQNLAVICAKFLIGHNAEPDAVDLLEEVEIADRVVEMVDENTFRRVAAYMLACVPLLPPQDDVAFLRTVHSVYEKFARWPEALAVALRLNDPELVRADFTAPGNPAMRKQLAFILARAGTPVQWLLSTTDDGEGEQVVEDLPEDLQEILYNTKLSEHFRSFGKDVGVGDAKSLEDVYKSHLENSRMFFLPCLAVFARF